MGKAKSTPHAVLNCFVGFVLLAGCEAFVRGKAFSLNTASGACPQEILLRASAEQLPFGCPRTLPQPTVVVAEGV